ncbi:MAG: hypothetical protein CM1200mP30_01660 [Pseudomonadota bacterium]|nr:MAG: hypothetical protein CM1200mP30_01660 [Pseudomonadota bacterium]
MSLKRTGKSPKGKFLNSTTGKVHLRNFASLSMNVLKIFLEVKIQMEFPGYFLIVSEFIKWSKENGFQWAPGAVRGRFSCGIPLLITGKRSF